MRLLLDVYRFLSSNRAKPITMAMIMPTVEPKMYVSVMGAGIGVGGGVGCVPSSTFMAVSANEA